MQKHTLARLLSGVFIAEESHFTWRILAVTLRLSRAALSSITILAILLYCSRACLPA
jgi:hypothetical protein